MAYYPTVRPMMNGILRFRANKVLLGTNLRCASVCPRARRYAASPRWRRNRKVIGGMRWHSLCAA
jgi:hypothetical protein